MKDHIKQFLNSTDKVMLIPHDKGSNVIHELRRVRTPSRIVFNFLVMQGCKIIPSVRIKHFVYTYVLGMNVGKNVGFAIIDVDPFLPELITIEDNATIGWGARLLSHEYTQKSVRVGRINIGKCALVGAFSTVRSGVTIGENSIVAMNSLVNKDIPPNELWGGVPAKRIRKLKEPI